MSMGRHLSMPAFALAVTVGVSALGGVGDRDWVLIVPALDDPRICAKGHAECLAAQEAIAAGRWDVGLPRDTETQCRPSPACFPAAGLTIPGYSK